MKGWSEIFSDLVFMANNDECCYPEKNQEKKSQKEPLFTHFHLLDVSHKKSTTFRKTMESFYISFEEESMVP